MTFGIILQGERTIHRVDRYVYMLTDIKQTNPNIKGDWSRSASVVFSELLLGIELGNWVNRWLFPLYTIKPRTPKHATLNLFTGTHKPYSEELDSFLHFFSGCGMLIRWNIFHSLVLLGLFKFRGSHLGKHEGHNSNVFKEVGSLGKLEKQQ